MLHCKVMRTHLATLSGIQTPQKALRVAGTTEGQIQMRQRAVLGKTQRELRGSSVAFIANVHQNVPTTTRENKRSTPTTHPQSRPRWGDASEWNGVKRRAAWCGTVLD